MLKIIAALTLFAVTLPAGAQPAGKSVGQLEYENKCIKCHGVTGKGDGWFSRFLKQPPRTLTLLKKNNGGVFPFDHVYQVIDGRKDVQVHGPRDMPVWGGVYRVESGRVYDTDLGQYLADDGLVRARILALAEYVSRLQE